MGPGAEGAARQWFPVLPHKGPRGDEQPACPLSLTPLPCQGQSPSGPGWSACPRGESCCSRRGQRRSGAAGPASSGWFLEGRGHTLGPQCARSCPPSLCRRGASPAQSASFSKSSYGPGRQPSPAAWGQAWGSDHRPRLAVLPVVRRLSLGPCTVRAGACVLIDNPSREPSDSVSWISTV